MVSSEILGISWVNLSVSESEKYSNWKLRNNLLLFDQEYQKKLKHLISVLLSIPQNLIYYLSNFFDFLFLIIVYSTISHTTVSFSFMLRIAFFFFNKLRFFGKDYCVNKLRFWPNDFCLEVSVPLFIEVKVSRRQHNWVHAWVLADWAYVLAVQSVLLYLDPIPQGLQASIKGG